MNTFGIGRPVNSFGLGRTRFIEFVNRLRQRVFISLKEKQKVFINNVARFKVIK